MRKKLQITNHRLQNNQGFTLIEVIIIVVIATMVFIAMYSFYANTIKYDTESRYEIIASNLAQEGVELCRNGRDSMLLSDGNLNNFGDSVPNDCTNGSSINGFQFGGNTFERNCTIDDSDKPTKFIIDCTVTWKSFVLKNNAERSVTAQAILTNWAETN